MKGRFILPFVAVVFALASAFATPVFNQMGWFDPDGTGEVPPVNALITTPVGGSPQCTTSGVQICKIGEFDAYVSAQAATTQDPDGLLRYNDVE